MSSFSDMSVFAIVLAINLLLLGALFAGGLAVVLRFTENASPRLRYLASIAIFLAAILIPLSATVFKNPAEQKSLIVADPEAKQKIENENLLISSPAAVDETVEFNLPPTPRETSKKLFTSIVLIVKNPFVGSLFFSIWILGSGVLFLREIIGFWRLKKSIKLWVPANDFERESLHCPRNISLYFADEQTPGTIGWLRPAIVLPKKFPAEISLESKRFIVRHELAHARWRDPLARFILRAVKNLFWISPALWLIENLTDAEREAAADRAAMIVLGKAENSRIVAFNYAETLLSIAKSFGSTECKKRQPQIVGIGAESDLEIRIRRILSSRQTTHRQIFSAVCACVLTTILTAVVPITSFSEIIRRQDDAIGSFNDGQNILLAATDDNNSSLKNNSEVLSPTETSRETNTSVKSKIPLKKSDAENLAPEGTVISQSPARQNISNANYSEKNDANSASANVLSDKGDDEAELRENQQAAAKLSDLKSLSPMSNSLNDELKSLGKLRPASALKNALADENELSRQKTAIEPAGRQNYRANYPAAQAVPKQESYETKYVPYPARQSEQ